MSSTAALDMFNDELRTLLLNVLFHQSQETRYRVWHIVASCVAAILVIVGLMTCSREPDKTTFVLAALAALVAYMGIVSKLADRRSHYARMRGKYNTLYVEARDVHRCFVAGRLP